MDFKSTTSKLKSSRIIKLSLIGIGILFLIKIISFIFIAWLIHLTSKELDLEKIRVYSDLIKIVNIPITTGIASIVVAVIGRYGIREGMSHLSK